MNPEGAIVRLTARFLINSVVVAAFLLGSTASLATQVRPVNIEEMTAFAERIFSGTCIEATAFIDPELGLPMTRATFAVERAIKGDVGATVTIKMVGDRTSAPARSQDAAGTPTFVVGEEVILFLYAESHLGLTAPVGLGQGKFSVYTDKHGEKIALNTLRNKNLLRGLSNEAADRLDRTATDEDPRDGLPLGKLIEMADTLAPLPAKWEMGR